jgi:hypothetical protein
MNARLGIPATLQALRKKDIAALARAACHEADANYPVPLYMSQADCEAVIRQVLPIEPHPKSKAREKAVRKNRK